MRMLRIAGAAAAAVLTTLSLLGAPAQAAADGTGVIQGTVTDRAGQPSDAHVTAYRVGTSFERSVYAEGGHYRFEELPAGSYKLKLYDNYYGQQWLSGADTSDDARVFEVADGVTITADEQWLPFGAVRVTVTDAETGRPVPEPCASVGGRDKCSADGVVELTDVPPGYRTVRVSGGSSYFSDDDERFIEVTRSRTTEVSRTLVPGAAVTTRVVDAATGEPIRYICLRMVDPVWSGQSARMGQSCTNKDGEVGLGPFEGSFDVNLYAFQSRNELTTTLYGDQWVGASGGTGDQREARTVRFTARRTTAVPEIRMDPPGTITGTVRDAATGSPIGGVCAYPYAVDPIQGGTFGKHCSDDDGTYVIDDVGPYRWPVEFTPYLDLGYAWRWSGNAPHRFAATYSKVTAGGSVTADAALVRAGALAGRVTRAGEPDSSTFIVAYDRTTRDPAGSSRQYSDWEGDYELGGFGSHDLWVHFNSGDTQCWYGTTPARATPVRTTAGQTTALNLDLGGNCAPVPGGTARSTDRGASVRGLLSGS